ncbi:unnamed protein product [Thelazia callipaeda]|uniref:MTP large subunit lipid-binding domain-containing protein n=1 Tax=Thelazia callipaeda TaxID=103827 RepID=A0A3P7MFQ5_THECL|nr:unnamed protein product [Thelazia callipaeda]
MQIFVRTSGLKSHSLDSDDYNISNDHDDTDNEDLFASAQISFLKNNLVPVTIFDGYNDLISIVWNADGQLLPLFDINLISRQYYGYVPLISGLSITIDIMGTISVATMGSAKVSFWNKDAKLEVDTNLSTKLEGSISLSSDNNLLRKATATHSATGTVSVRFDTDFLTVPHIFCYILSQSSFFTRYL